MKAFFAIVKLTLKSAMRSHIFQLLLFLLVLSAWLLPATITDDGTAGGFIRISLKYSLVAAGAVLSLSSIWLGCLVMSQDVDSYQLHMVVTKPVSRVKIWLAKWTGVTLMHLVLLFAAAMAIYFVILWKYQSQDFPAEEREKIRNEVMVGRRVYSPDRPDMDSVIKETVRRKIKRLTDQGTAVDTSPEAQEKMYNDTKAEVFSQQSEAKFGQPQMWRFRNLPENLKKPLFLRFRPYVDKVATEGQRMTRIWWEIGVPKLKKAEAANVFEQNQGKTYEIFFLPLAQLPEQVMSGRFHEKTLKPEWNVITPDNEVLLRYTNADDSQATQFFQPIDGPILLVEECGFFMNYLRAVLVIAIQLMLLSGLACAAGGFLTLPTAIFVVISYLLFGSFSVYMTGQTYFGGAADYVGYYIGKALLLVVIPLQSFEVSGFVANGELVEFSFIWTILLHCFILRAIPLFLLGIFFYRRRELGLVIRK